MNSFYQCLHKKDTPNTCLEYVEGIKLTLPRTKCLKVVRTWLEKINHINSINHKIAQNYPAPGKITKNQLNALNAPAMHNLNVVWFQFFTILNKIDRLTFITGKSQFT